MNQTVTTRDIKNRRCVAGLRSFVTKRSSVLVIPEDETILKAQLLPLPSKLHVHDVAGFDQSSIAPDFSDFDFLTFTPLKMLRWNAIYVVRIEDVHEA